LKVALVTPYYFPHLGGVTEHVYALYRYFKKQGLEVKVLTSAFGKKSTSPNEEDVIRIGRAVSFYINGSFGKVTLPFQLSQKVEKVLADEKFDLLHLHEPLLPTFPLTVLRHSEEVKVGTFHAYATKNLGYQLLKKQAQKYYNQLKGRIVVSRAAGELVSKYLKGGYVIIPNGVDTKRFSPQNLPFEEFKDGKLNILFVGRIEPRKGLKFLLQAFNLVKKSFSQVRLIIVGKGSLLKYYQRSIEDEVREDIHFLGQVPYEVIPRYYATGDIFCSPATGKESFGIILLEALASGKPVVASEIAGYREVIESEKEGILVPPKDPEKLAEALLRLLKDRNLRVEMGQRGREKALSYDWGKVTARILNYYQQILTH
jgi:phosphatidylinositol alpha-mannosyltransferase